MQLWEGDSLCARGCQNLVPIQGSRRLDEEERCFVWRATIFPFLPSTRRNVDADRLDREGTN